MPRFGAHMSIAGGLEKAVIAAVHAGCDCLQVFVKNQRQWRAGPLTEAQVRLFRAAVRVSGVRPIIAHATYLINLAAPDGATRRLSLDAVTDELLRCEALGIRRLVLHPGAHVGEGLDAGIRRVIQAIDEVHAREPGLRARIALECTAGQGSCLGSDLAELDRIIGGVREPQRLAVCLDSCHLFTAGYDLRSADGYERTLELLARHVGLRRVCCIHVNDSARECGSRVDRHAHIGKGHIGRAGFTRLVNDPRFAEMPMILETPKGTDQRGTDLDRINLRRLRSYLKLNS